MYACSTHSSMTISLEVHTNIKLQGCVMKVFHSSFGTLHYYLNSMKTHECQPDITTY